MKKIEIKTPFIKLGDAMKLEFALTGGEAKTAIQNGKVTVDGKVCLMRGKKLLHGNIVEFDGKQAVVEKVD